MADLDFSRMFSGASPALASLAPIPVVNTAAGGQLEFRPLSAVTPVSAHPEAIAMGLGQGIQDVAKGYLAAVQQKKQDKLAEEERKRKADLDEREMKLKEGRFGMEKEKYSKELQDRIAAVGADKFPGDSRTAEAPIVGSPEATETPTTEPSEATGSSSGLPLVGTVFPTASFTGEAAPFQKEKYTREANTFRFAPEAADYTPSTQVQPIQMVPKPLSSTAPVVPSSNVFAQTSEMSAVRNPLADLKAAYDVVAGKVKRFSELEGASRDKYTRAVQSGGSTEEVPGTLSNLRETFFPSGKQAPVENIADKKAETPSPQASYQYPEGQWNRLQQATSGNLKDLSPYLTASADTGDMSTDQTKALPPTLPVPEKKQELYPLDLSQMYGIQYKEQPKLVQAQQPQPAQEAPKPAEKFAIPERPTADQIPKDFATRDYEAARREQAKDYGFYYEPMGRIETHKDANGLWYKVVRDPEKTTVLEQKLGRLESMAQRYDKYQLQQQNTIDREQSKFYSNPDVRAFTAPNGMRQSFSRFVKDYDAILKNPEASGISDIGLLDMFGRAEGGGRITEGQAALALRAVGILDKPEQLIQKLQGGARLSQNQRDQMLRVIAEDHSAQASLANQQIEMVRQKLQHQGITDETMLPQPYIIPITKWDFEEKSKQARALNTQLQLQKTEAMRNNDTASVEQINQQLTQLQQEMDPLYKMAKRAKKDKDGKIIDGILNSHEIEHTPQGWAGGAVATFQQQEP